MVKIIGRISTKQSQAREQAYTRTIKAHGKVLGSVILTDIKAFPFSWARVNVIANRSGLHAIRNGQYIRPVSAKLLKDNSFQAV